MKRIFVLLAVSMFLLLASCTTSGPSRRKPYSPSGSLQKGRKLFSQGKYSDAREEFIALIKKEPDNSYAYYYLGLINLENYQSSLARHNFIRALGLNPGTDLCRAIQDVMLLDNSRLIGSGKAFWMSPAFLDEKSVVALAISSDTDGDGKISPLDNASIVKTTLATRKSEVLVDESYIKGPPMPDSTGGRIVYASARTDTNGDGKVSFDDNSGIFLFNLATREEQCIVNGDFHCADPSFSADGKSVFFVSIRLDTNSDEVIDFNDNFAVYRYNFETKETTKVTALPGDCRRPVETSAGNGIYFWGVGEDTNNDGVINTSDNGGLYCYNASVPSLEPVINWENEIHYFNFSVRGEQVVVVMNPHPGIYLVNLVTMARRKVVTPTTELLGQPSLSPDNHTIAFQRIQNRGTLFLCYYFDSDNPFLTAEELKRALSSSR